VLLNKSFKMMENALEDRDAVGVSDAVLLDDPNDTPAFIENLRKRFRGDLIYVSTLSSFLKLLKNARSSVK